MESGGSQFLRLAAVTTGLALLISLIVVVIGLVYHWDQPVQSSNGFFIAGAVIIVLGVCLAAGGFAQRASFPITYAETASQASIPQRTQRMMADINQRYGMIVLFGGAGILLMGISVAIELLL